MKKIYSLALILALLLSLSTPALAEENSVELNALGNADVAVNAVFEAGIEGGTVFSIDIAWENMSFTYKGESEDTWDPDKHEYNKTSEAAGWTTDSVGTITVTNHSNAFITIRCDYLKKSGFENTGMQFAYSSYDCDSSNIGVVYSAEIGNKAQTTTITVTPDGTLPEDTPADTPIGSIRVALNSWDEPNTDAAESFSSSASGKLDGLEEEDRQLVQECITRLDDAISVADAEDRSTLLAMYQAYIELSTIMVDLRI